jgi:hypothetical protein
MNSRRPALRTLAARPIVATRRFTARGNRRRHATRRGCGVRSRPRPAAATARCNSARFDGPRAVFDRPDDPLSAASARFARAQCQPSAPKHLNDGGASHAQTAACAALRRGPVGQTDAAAERSAPLQPFTDHRVRRRAPMGRRALHVVLRTVADCDDAARLDADKGAPVIPSRAANGDRSRRPSG